MSARSAIAAESLKRGVMLLVASLLLGLATTASPALAAQTHVFRGAVGAGELTAPAGIAVDAANGDLYVADRGSSTIHRFDATGAPAPFTPSGTDELGPFSFPEGAQQVAVDNSTGVNAGHFYVLDGATVKAFDADGEPAPFTATAGYLSGNAITGDSSRSFEEPSSVAVDSEGDIYVSDFDQGVLRIYAPSGELLTSVEEELIVPDLAVPDSSGIVYAGNNEIEYTHVFTPSSTPPGPTTTYTASPPSFLLGYALAVEPGSDQVYTSNSTSPQNPTTITQRASFALGNGPINTFGAEQLAAGVTSVAAVGPGGPSAGEVYVATGTQVDRFGPLATVPDVVTEPATAIDPATGSATLNGTVDPDGLPLTSCEFEYGTTFAYGRTAECAGGPGAVGTGGQPKVVSARVTGLAPGTYHFRLVAANANGEATPGADRNFTTEPAIVSTDCPNEALRMGPSALLPECRAYEMVSPVDKNGGAVYAQYNYKARSTGEEIEFLSTSAFAGAPANTLNAYIARRGADGWETSGIDAPQLNSSALMLSTTFATSEDFSKTMQLSFRALAPGAVEGNTNLYMRDNATGALTLVATEPRNFHTEGLEKYIEQGFATTSFGGGTSNWSRIFFSTTATLVEGANPNAVNIYEFSNGRLGLAKVPAVGSEPEQLAAGLFITPDGSKVFLTDQNGYLYVSKDGAAPVPVTASQRAGEVGRLIKPNQVTISRNGDAVFFISGERLTEDTPSEQSLRLFRYDVESGTLTDLTKGEAPQVERIYDVSDDGARAYVQSKGTLSADSTPARGATFDVFGWHQGEGFAFVTRTEAAVPLEVGGFSATEISPDGRYLAIQAFSRLTPADATSADCPARASDGNPAGYCRNVYVYDAVSGSLTCASCNGPGLGNSNLGGVSGGSPALDPKGPQAVLDDGSVFFDSPNRLLPRDTNGVTDVYRFRNSVTSLISTGTSSEESSFADVTPSERDIFFRTSQPLVGQDIDSRLDLYDARVDGGIASQNPSGSPAPCEGDSCKGAGTSPPPPLGGRAEATQDLCKAISGRATKARKAASRLAKEAKKATGKHAKVLRKRVAQERKKARKLTKNTTQCRRQGK